MINIKNVSDKTYIVLGLGKSGMATAFALKQSGADVMVWDDKPVSRDAAEKEGYRLGNPAEIDLSGIAALILSPGIPLTNPAPHPAVAKCHAADVPVIGDMELLFRACPDATYIGITGTNGKSTTTALIAHILRTAGRKVEVGGNLGKPVMEFDNLGNGEFYVIELSSYQLDLMRANPLAVAVLLNITPDHLDRHGDMSGYVAAKKRVIRTDAPQTLVIGNGEAETRDIRNWAMKQHDLRVEDIEAQEARLTATVAWTELKTLLGSHNRQNACAAFAVCEAVGLTPQQIANGLRTFPGLAHRQQLVAEINGVRFVNDSKATNADAASKALACYDDIYWIIGGKPKAGGLDGLEAFMPRIRHAFLIGEAAGEFAAWLDGKAPHTNCGNLNVAVERAALTAWKEGIKNAVVLLSPACASFDQFANFEERGDMFAALVGDLSPPVFSS